MGNKGIIGLLLAGLLAFFIFNVWTWWNNGEIIQEYTSTIIALATIIYAIFTASMFWNMKSSSEAQVRPFLYTKLQEDMDLKIYNKLEKNVAKNLKIRVKAIKIKKDIRKSKFLLFIHQYLLKSFWDPLWDHFGSYKKDFEIMEDNKSPSLIKYLEERFPIKEEGDEYEGFSLNVKNKKGKINLKILVHISYESLLDVKYEIDEVYYVSINNSNVEIKKVIN